MDTNRTDLPVDAWPSDKLNMMTDFNSQFPNRGKQRNYESTNH